MLSTAFTLCVPADDRFRGLVADAVQAYLKTSDAIPAASIDAFLASVSAAVARLAPGGTDFDVVVEAGASRVDVRLTCGDATETLTHRS